MGARPQYRCASREIDVRSARPIRCSWPGESVPDEFFRDLVRSTFGRKVKHHLLDLADKANGDLQLGETVSPLSFPMSIPVQAEKQNATVCFRWFAATCWNDTCQRTDHLSQSDMSRVRNARGFRTWGSSRPSPFSERSQLTWVA